MRDAGVRTFLGRAVWHHHDTDVPRNDRGVKTESGSSSAPGFARAQNANAVAQGGSGRRAGLSVQVRRRPSSYDGSERAMHRRRHKDTYRIWSTVLGGSGITRSASRDSAGAYRKCLTLHRTPPCPSSPVLRMLLTRASMEANRPPLYRPDKVFVMAVATGSRGGP